MKVRRKTFLIAICLVTFSSPLPAQTQSTSGNSRSAQSLPPLCDAGELELFSFMVGEWQTEGPRGLTVGQVFDDCGYQEHWTGGGTEAWAVRSWDPKSKRMFYTWVSPVGAPQIWEGRKENGHWCFYRQWELDGEKILSRTFWISKESGRFDRHVEQSRDGGKTWKPHVLAEYSRVK